MIAENEKAAERVRRAGREFDDDRGDGADGEVRPEVVHRRPSRG